MGVARTAALMAAACLALLAALPATAPAAAHTRTTYLRILLRRAGLRR